MRKRRKKGTGIGVIAFIVLILFGIISYRRFGLEQEEATKDADIKKLNTQISEQEERAVDLENLSIYNESKQYIEDIAREKLGLVYEDEIIFQREE